MVIPKDINGVFVPMVNITTKYIPIIIKDGIIFLVLTSIKTIIGVNMEIIPLISLAELKNPSVPAFVIS